MWGEYNRKVADKVLPEYKNKRSVAGNLRLDIPKYSPMIKPEFRKSNSIGIIGRFEALNNYTGRPAIILLAEEDEKFLKDVINQSRQFHGICRVIRHLIENTDLNISIRPHPLEAPEGYERIYGFFPKNRVSIDNSYDYTAWLYQQKMIFAPASTTYLEAYLLKIPIVNIDKALDIEDEISYLNPFTSLAHKCSYMPDTLKELLNLLKGTPEPITGVREIDEHLKDVHGWDPDFSVLNHVSNRIADFMVEKGSRSRLKIPGIVSECLDWRQFIKSMISTRLHANFNYKSAYHKIPPYFREISENIAYDKQWPFLNDPDLKRKYSNKNFIIGGPPRNGKTTLTNSLALSMSVAGLPVEGLLDIFHRRHYFLRRHFREMIAVDYMAQGRYTDQARERESAPQDYMSSSLNKILNRIPVKPEDNLEVVFSVLKVFAEDNGKRNWAVCDLLSERYFEIYRKYCENLHAVIVLRDPRESICASLFWRNYPDKIENSSAFLRHAVLTWVFSANAFFILKKRYPEDISFLRFNKLFDETSPDSIIMSRALKIPPDTFKNIMPDKLYFFKYHGNGLFLAPSGEKEELLNDEERSFIRYYTFLWAEKCGFIFEKPHLEKKDTEFEAVLEKMLSISEYDLTAAKNFIDASEYSPYSRGRKEKEIFIDFKRIARNIILGK
jgi:hypothetical protein